jgi:hypothetical protein
MDSLVGIFVGPICGIIVDYKAERGIYFIILSITFFLYLFLGYAQKIFNVSILQTLTWIIHVFLCIVCMFHSIIAALMGLASLALSRAMIIPGSQAVVATLYDYAICHFRLSFLYD